MYWKATDSSKKWKLLIYDAIIKSKLLYGMETTHVTKVMQKKIDAFQLRGLRKILRMQTTYTRRTNTNVRVLAEATKFAYNKQGDNRQIQLFGETYWHRRAKLAAHVLRSPSEDPMRQISYENHTAQKQVIGTRRIGGPRQNWIKETNKYIYEQKMNKNNYTATLQQDTEILSMQNNNTSRKLTNLQTNNKQTKHKQKTNNKQNAQIRPLLVKLLCTEQGNQEGLITKSVA
jgi:hypothetical protein